jgi:integrase
MTKILKSAVDKAHPSLKDTYIWDDDLKGFGLKTTPKGKKVYLVQYRIGGRKGRTRRITIGAHGTVTAEQARWEAKRLLGEVASGRDPASFRDQVRAESTIGTLLDQFRNEHIATKLKPKSAEEYCRNIRLYIVPAFGDRLISSVQRSDVLRLHHELRDKPYQANRVLAILSKFFNWAEKQGYCASNSNPCRHVEKYREEKRERFLTEDEMKRLGDALNEAEELKTTSPWIVAAIRLLAFTGARLSEIRTMKWDYLDLERGTVRLPDSKTGKKTIYLNEQAIDVLEKIPRLEDNPYVICGNIPGAHLVNLQKPWRRIRKAAGLEDVRIHDLRHSFASAAVAGGMSLPMIGALLGHSQPQTTARYAHLGQDPLLAASDAVGNRIFNALSPTDTDSD